MLKTRIPPPLYAFATAMAMLGLDRTLPIARLPTGSFDLLGWILVFAGVALDAGAFMLFLKARTTINPMRIERASHLVTTGLYRFSRNPMYLGLMVTLSGWAILLGSLGPLLPLILFEQLLVAVQIRPEEAALEARFGGLYRDYKTRVGRWIGWR
jgi:protein-S-isoprenylcysteine O-methyltransferase Ste14